MVISKLISKVRGLVKTSSHTSTQSLDNQFRKPKDLNPEQFQAASWQGSHVLVLAGAGCGKTKTIIARAEHLIENVVAPSQIQILTFTRRASAEIVERVKSKLGDKADGLRASTFHTWCMSLIRKGPDLFGCRGYSVIDRDDQLIIFRMARAASKLSKDPLLPKPAELCDIYSYARNVGKTLKVALEAKAPISMPIFEEIAAIMITYEKRKEDRKYLDYDDILDVVARQINDHEDVLDWVSSNHSEILVDEFQDTNPLQWKLLFPLLNKVRLFCVGDDAQSIYGFRGADFQNIHCFKERVNDSEVLKLSLNYRSTQEILDLSNWLLEKSDLKYGKKLESYRGSGLTPVVHSFNNEWAEARWIAEDLKRTHSEGVNWKENMILTRTSYAARAVESSLIENKIPYVFIGGRKLFESAHVKDVLSALRVIANPQDELGWMRYLRLWAGVGDTTASRAIADIEGISLLSDCIEKLRANPRIPKDALVLLQDASFQESTVECFRKCVQGLANTLEENYKTKNWDKRIRDFLVIEKLAEKTGSILEFLEAYILEPLYIDEIEPVNGDDVVTLITIHSAKGAESKRCYVINVSPGAYPLTRALLEESEIEEERRVLYVAITRAKDELILTRSGNASAASSLRRNTDPNERYFLVDIPKDIYVNSDHRMSNRSNNLKKSKDVKRSKPSTNLDIE